MRIAFLGTPEFAVPSLKMLVESGHDIAVFTQPDRPKGRGKSLAMPEVKRFALDAGLPVYQFEKIRSEDGLAALTGFAPELMVTAAFGQLLSKANLAVAKHGCINVHGSLLPKYRGASPIESAILAGDNDFSVSIMKLVKAMDAGPIYYQTTLHDLPLTKDEIYKALAETGAEWLRENLENLPEPTLQDGAEATYCGKLDKSMSLLAPDTDTAEETLRKIIAFQGYPKPKYTFYGVNCIILEAHILEQGETALLPLPCADGQILAIDRLQPEGKKPMDAKSFLNGYKR